MKYIFLLLAALSFPVLAWETVAPNTYTIYGTRIQQSTEMLTPFAEIAYNSSTDSFGISFLNSDGSREKLSYGIFNMRVCGKNTSGAIAGSALESISETGQMNELFYDCKRPMFLQVWDTQNNHVTYKFENIGPIFED